MTQTPFGAARALRRLGIAGALVLCCAPDASAQLIEGRPFRALFRTVANPADSKHPLDFTAFLSAGRDEITISAGEVENLLDPRLRSGSFGSMVLRARYAYEGRRSQFGVDAGLTSRYYSRVGDTSLMNMFGGVNWTSSMGERGRFNLSQRVSHAPFYAYGVDMSEQTEQPFEPLIDERVLRLETTSYDSRVGLNYQIGRRSYLGLDYGLRYVDVTPRSTFDRARDIITHRPRISYRKQVGRYASLNLGYGLRRSEYLDSGYAPVTAHDVNFGLGYSRPLSSSRRTRIGFSTGSTITQVESTQLYLTGSAYLRHAITRTWNTVLAYHRGMDVREGFDAPFLFSSDSVSATLSGRLAGPVTMLARGYYTHGRFTVASLENRSDWMSALLSVNVPVTTMVAATVQGYYSDQSFERRVGLLTGVPLETNTYGVRVGLSLWVPVVR